MKYILIALALVLIPATVSADSVVVDGVTVNYDGDEVTEAEVLDAIEKFGLPPAPPAWPVGEVEVSTESGQIDNQSADESGTSIADMNLERDIQEYHERYGWLNDVPF